MPMRNNTSSSQGCSCRPMRVPHLILSIVVGLALGTDSTLAQPSLYWTAGVANKIQRYDLSGKLRVTDLVVAPLASPGRIWLDARRHTMYWNSLGRNQIRRALIDGSEVRDLLSGQLLDVDFDSDKMYLNRADILLRANLDGTAVEKLMTLHDPVYNWSDAIAAVDVNGGAVYWCSSEPPGIRKANLDGTASELIYEGDAVGLMIDPYGARMYWQTGGDCGSLVSANLDGTGPETVVDGCVDSAFLDINGGRLYWATQELSAETFHQEFYRSDLDGSETTLLFGFQDWRREVNGMTFNPDSQTMYWTSDDRIQRAYQSGAGLQDLIVTDMFAPRGLALDQDDGMMYWGSVYSIQRSDLFGDNRQTIVKDLDAWVYDVAIDPVGERLYWIVPADVASNKIQRARLDGFGIEDVVTFTGNPFSLVLDPEAGFMYWTDAGRIVRAGLDGSNVTTLIDRGSDVSFHDIVLDTERQRAYWTAGRSMKGVQLDVEEVGWSRMDGTSTEILFSESYAWWGSLALDAASGFVYWAVTRNGTVWRVPVDGADQKEFVTSVLGNLTSLVFVDAGAGTPVAEEALPAVLALYQNYPNPFHSATVIRYELGVTDDVRLVVRDVLGRDVVTLVDQLRPPGSYTVSWTPTNRLPAGVYFYALKIGNRRMTKAALLVR